MNNSKPILHIDDDEIDAMTVKRVFMALGIPNKLVQKNNGQEGLKYLRDSANEKPCLILLDLNMPLMNGREFLGIVQKDPSLCEIPVIILTTSEIDRDLVGANVVGYIVKSMVFSDFAAGI